MPYRLEHGPTISREQLVGKLKESQAKEIRVWFSGIELDELLQKGRAYRKHVQMKERRARLKLIKKEQEKDRPAHVAKVHHFLTGEPIQPTDS